MTTFAMTTQKATLQVNNLGVMQSTYQQIAWNDFLGSNICRKTLTSNIASARNQRHTKDSVFWLAEMTLYVMT